MVCFAKYRIINVSNFRLEQILDELTEEDSWQACSVIYFTDLTEIVSRILLYRFTCGLLNMFFLVNG